MIFRGVLGRDGKDRQRLFRLWQRNICARASVLMNQNEALDFCFDAFSSREPVSTSLENALLSESE
jgi:hypothetical protein